MKRRDLIKGALATGTLVTAPVRAFAQPTGASVRDRKLFALAKEQLEKAGDVIWKNDIIHNCTNREKTAKGFVNTVNSIFNGTEILQNYIGQ